MARGERGFPGHNQVWPSEDNLDSCFRRNDRDEACRGAKPLCVSLPQEWGLRGLKRKEHPVNTYDGFHINNGATYCIVIR